MPLAGAALAEISENSSYAQIVAIAGRGHRVLDVGCGPGNLAALLIRNGSTVVGVDNDPISLEVARTYCESVHLADLDRDDLAEMIGNDGFDAIVFADILEHLRDPLRVLLSAKTLLRDGGSMYVSIPNIAHGAVRLSLLRGEFSYQRLGILDETHVRFYTRASVEELLADAGLAIVELRRTWAPIFEESDLVPFVRREDFPESLVDEIEADPESKTLQFIVKAEPSALATASVVRSKRATLAQELRTLEARYAQLERGVQEDRINGERQLTELLTTIVSEREAAAVLKNELADSTHAYETQVLERRIAQQRTDDLVVAMESLEESFRGLIDTYHELLGELEKGASEVEVSNQERRAMVTAKAELRNRLYSALQKIHRSRGVADLNAVLERTIVERDGQIARIALKNERIQKNLDFILNLHLRVNRQFVDAFEASDTPAQRRDMRPDRQSELVATKELFPGFQAPKVRRLGGYAFRLARKVRRWLPF